MNYQEEVHTAWAEHVAMGALLFHRSILERLHFRTLPDACDCACCCYDLRRMGYGVDYARGMRAVHLPRP
jgi:hypothetical protein